MKCVFAASSNLSRRRIFVVENLSQEIIRNSFMEDHYY
jgi:hypothetical protein